MAETGWNALFDLRDDSDIQRAIQTVGRFDNVYNDFIGGLRKNSRVYGREVDKIITSTKELQETMRSVNPVTEEGRQSLANISRQADINSDTYKVLTTRIAELEKRIKSLTKEQANVRKGSVDLNNINKEAIKLEARLGRLSGERAKENAELRVQIQERNKELRRTARESLGLITVYQREAQRLAELRTEYKSVALTQGIASEEAQRLQREVQELDETLKEVDASAGQFQRNVGNYPELLESVGGAAGIATTGVQSLGIAFRALLANPIVAILAAIVGAVLLVFNAFKRLTGGAEILEQVISGVSTVFNTLLGRIGQLISGEISLREFFFETGDAIRDTVRASIRLVRIRRQIERATADLAFQESQLNETLSAQTRIRDNDAVSLRERLAAAQRSARILNRLSLERLRFVGLEVQQAALQVENTVEGAEDRRTAELAYTQAVAKLIETRTQNREAEADAEREIQLIQLDLFEQQLDLLIDVDDRRRTVNERALRDERLLLSQRIAIVRQNAQITEDSFQRQIAAFNEFFGVQIDGNKIVRLSGIELFNYAQSLGLSERAVNRLREVVIEKQSADQDNLDLIRETNKAIGEQISSLRNLQNITTVTEEERRKQNEESQNVLTRSWGVYFDNFLRRSREAFRQSAEGIRQQISESLDAIRSGINMVGDFINAFSGIADAINQQDEQRLQELEERQQRELELAGENASQREAIEVRFARRREAIEDRLRQRQRRQAIADKAIAVTKSIIDTATAVVEALPNIPLSIAVGALGAAQTGAILATPIPAFFKGTDNAPSGPKLVGELGTEAVVEKSGKVWFTGNKPEVRTDIPKGSTILDHLTTSKLFGHNPTESNIRASEIVSDFVRGERRLAMAQQAQMLMNNGQMIVDGFNKSIGAQPQNIFSIKNGELVRAMKRGNTLIENSNKVNSYE